MLNQKLAKGEVFPGDEAQCSRASHTRGRVLYLPGIPSMSGVPGVVSACLEVTKEAG